jgi:hypothetical protein
VSGRAQARCCHTGRSVRFLPLLSLPGGGRLVVAAVGVGNRGGQVGVEPAHHFIIDAEVMIEGFALEQGYVRDTCSCCALHEGVSRTYPRQATHAPEGTEGSLVEDGQDRSAARWLHGSSLRMRASSWLGSEALLAQILALLQRQGKHAAV